MPGKQHDENFNSAGSYFCRFAPWEKHFLKITLIHKFLHFWHHLSGSKCHLNYLQAPIWTQVKGSFLDQLVFLCYHQPLFYPWLGVTEGNCESWVVMYELQVCKFKLCACWLADASTCKCLNRESTALSCVQICFPEITTTKTLTGLYLFNNHNLLLKAI